MNRVSAVDAEHECTNAECNQYGGGDEATNLEYLAHLNSFVSWPVQFPRADLCPDTARVSCPENQTAR